MTQFEKAMLLPIKCDICGARMHPLYGDGVDYDRIACSNLDCLAEIMYPTSTEYPGAEKPDCMSAETKGEEQ